MKCAKCGFMNPAETSFCRQCGAPLRLPEDIYVSPTKTLEAPAEKLTRGATFAQRYEVIEELGSGGMGKVYRVLDKKVNEEVALKLIKPEVAADRKTIDRFANELRMARQISHKNVCRMYHLSEEEGIHYITMEYVPGENLKNMIRMTKQLSLGASLNVARQICQGLSEAHRLGIVHRDLKPSNIIIDRDGNARILDFGIARSVKSKAITGLGGLIGTPEYMSPEQAETREVDQRSDIYSLGVILFEMLTGKVPFEGETLLSVVMKHKSEKPPEPKKINPRIPDDLNRVILKCLEKDREKRYQSAEELLSDLTGLEERFPTTEKILPKKRPITTKELTVTIGLKKMFLPALIIIVMTVIGVILWQLLAPQETLAIPSDKPSLAIMYFKNNTGDQNLDYWKGALSDLLITDLSQSKYLRVMSAERLFDVLNRMDQLDTQSYSAEVLKEISDKTGVKKILIGNYTKAGDIYRINITIHDGESGELVGSERVEGKGEYSFYAMVDELTRRIKEDFEFTEEEIIADFDSEIEKITTSSPEAYKFYSLGRRYHLLADYSKALSFMQKALNIDPEFAMAYRSVAVTFHNMRMRPAKLKMIQKAFDLSDRVSERERLIIQGDYYKMREETYDKAIATFKKLLETYPEDSIGNTNLGGAYFALEQWENAINYFKMNIINKQGSLIAYWNLVEGYMAKGLYDIAKKTLDEALEEYPYSENLNLKLPFLYTCHGKYDLALVELDKVSRLSQGAEIESIFMRGENYLLKGDVDKAQQEFEKFMEGTGIRRRGMALLSLHKGRYGETIDLLNMKPLPHKVLGWTHLKSGAPKLALKEFDEMHKDALLVENILSQVAALHYKGLAYLDMKSRDKALMTASELKQLIDSGMSRKRMRYYYHLMGMIEMENGEYKKAIDYFEKANSQLAFPYDNRLHSHPLFFDSLALAYYKAGKKAEAQEQYEKIQALTYHRIWDGDIFAKSFFMLGKIAEEREERSKAVEYYEKFLDLWKNADPGIPEYREARHRLAALKGQ